MHLHCNSVTAVAIMQAGQGRDPFLQACAREAWLISAIHGMTLVVKHIVGEQLTATTDALSRYHTGGKFQARVEQLAAGSNITIIPLHPDSFLLSKNL